MLRSLGHIFAVSTKAYVITDGRRYAVTFNEAKVLTWRVSQSDWGNVARKGGTGVRDVMPSSHLLHIIYCKLTAANICHNGNRVLRNPPPSCLWGNSCDLSVSRDLNEIVNIFYPRCCNDICQVRQLHVIQPSWKWFFFFKFPEDFHARSWRLRQRCLPAHAGGLQQKKWYFHDQILFRKAGITTSPL